MSETSYGGKSPVSIKYENLHSFKEGVILLCKSIFETRRISHLHGSPLFTIPLSLISKKLRKVIKRKCITYPANICLFKLKDRNNRKSREICSKLKIKTPKRCQRRRSNVFIVKFEHISHFCLTFLFLTLNRRFTGSLTPS